MYTYSSTNSFRDTLDKTFGWRDPPPALRPALLENTELIVNYNEFASNLPSKLLRNCFELASTFLENSGNPCKLQ